MISLRQKLTYLEVKMHHLRVDSRILTRMINMSKQLDQLGKKGLKHYLEENMKNIEAELIDVLIKREEIIDQLPTEPTFTRIVSYYGPLFADKYTSSVRIEEPHVFRNPSYDIWWIVLPIDDDVYHHPPCEIITHRKLLALLRIDRWLKMNHQRILARLYHPSARLGQACVQRAMDQANL